MKYQRRFLLLVISAVLVITCSSNSYPQGGLGKVTFPTTCSEPAQMQFQEGVAALHSFWYEEALDKFKAATNIDSNCIIGFWGEAMTYNHPLWAQQDTISGQHTVTKFKDLPHLSDLERAYLNAVRLLYGRGNKLERDLQYSQAMAELYRRYPEDSEVACFYALSILGTVRPGDTGFRRQMLAGKIALDIFQRYPNHPGAAHYVIHSFDDPEHAILALPAAQRYSQIAPAAHHAQHMPSHIFLQLGMWDEAALSNETAWQVSDNWVKRKNLSIVKRDYHSLLWLLYTYLQQGRFKKADEVMQEMEVTAKQLGGEDSFNQPWRAEMAAFLVIETERWELASKLFPNTSAVRPNPPTSSADKATHAGMVSGRPSMKPQLRAEILSLFVRGMAAAARKENSEANNYLASLRALKEGLQREVFAYQAKQLDTMALELEAAILSYQGNHTQAIELIKKAAQLEMELSPPSGPPDLIKPSHELYGEILVRAGLTSEAIQQYSVALLRQPNRGRSLLGLARAQMGTGSRQEAVKAYSNFLKSWGKADPNLAELRESKDFLSKPTD